VSEIPYVKEEKGGSLEELAEKSNLINCSRAHTFAGFLANLLIAVECGLFGTQPVLGAQQRELK
jgi:hypothetical protein